MNRHTQEVQAKHSKFTRIPDGPGKLKILSIAHQQNLCKKVVDDIEVTVHPLPTASVSFGQSREDVIREGDQVSTMFPMCIIHRDLITSLLSRLRSLSSFLEPRRSHLLTKGQSCHLRNGPTTPRRCLKRTPSAVLRAQPTAYTRRRKVSNKSTRFWQTLIY